MATANRRRRLIAIVTGLPVALLGWCAIATAVQVHQAHLDAELITAINSRRSKQAVALLNQGANANAVSRQDPAEQDSNPIARIVQWFTKGFRPIRPSEEDGAGQPAIVLACTTHEHFPNGASSADPELLDSLLAHGASAKSVAESADVTVLQTQVIVGNATCVRLLLEHGADSGSGHRWTPLEGAATNCDIAVASLLLAHGARIDGVGVDGCTALHAAAAHEHGGPMIRYLLANRANVNAKDNSGRTPLMYAATVNTDDVELLVENGADAGLRDRAGRTAADHARESPDLERRDAVLRILATAMHGRKGSGGRQ